MLLIVLHEERRALVEYEQEGHTFQGINEKPHEVDNIIQ